MFSAVKKLPTGFLCVLCGKKRLTAKSAKNRKVFLCEALPGQQPRAAYFFEKK